MIGGLAGLSAATRAADFGLKPVILERGSEERYPCNSRFAGGVLHLTMVDMRAPPEQLLSTMLAATGELDSTIGGPSLSLTDTANHRRTLYGTIHRREMSTMLLTHDFPDPTAHSPRRQSTTTALQGLYALNGPLFLNRSESLAKRLAADVAGDDAERIQLAYRLLYAREPTSRETEIGLAYLGDSTGAERAAAWTQYAHVLLASNEFLFVD